MRKLKNSRIDDFECICIRYLTDITFCCRALPFQQSSCFGNVASSIMAGCFLLLCVDVRKLFYFLFIKYRYRLRICVFNAITRSFVQTVLWFKLSF